jgi:hypothetical protein
LAIRAITAEIRARDDAGAAIGARVVDRRSDGTTT